MSILWVDVPRKYQNLGIKTALSRGWSPPLLRVFVQQWRQQRRRRRWYYIDCMLHRSQFAFMCVRRSFHVKKIPKFLKLFLFKGTKNGFIRTRIGGGRERERGALRNSKFFRQCRRHRDCLEPLCTPISMALREGPAVRISSRLFWINSIVLLLLLSLMLERQNKNKIWKTDFEYFKFRAF